MHAFSCTLDIKTLKKKTKKKQLQAGEIKANLLGSDRHCVLHCDATVTIPPPWFIVSTTVHCLHHGSLSPPWFIVSTMVHCLRMKSENSMADSFCTEVFFDGSEFLFVRWLVGWLVGSLLFFVVVVVVVVCKKGHSMAHSSDFCTELFFNGSEVSVRKELEQTTSDHFGMHCVAPTRCDTAYVADSM